MKILEFAINMEVEGENYYLKQAELNKDNGLNVVFRALAEDERNHAELLRNKAKNEPCILKDSKAVAERSNVFTKLEDFKDRIMDIPKQIDAYREALKTEQDSIDLYTKLLAEETDEKGKELFDYLIKQEQEHYVTLEELIFQLRKAEEWVENAEFGVRKDY